MSATESVYRINEIFYSLQGEGYHTGRPAVFLRFSGCNRRCDFCDTAHTQSQLMTIAEIVEAVSSYPTRFLVSTGGEPLLQLDTPLIDALHGVGFEIAVETNGSIEAPEGIDWITCSPKEQPWHLGRCSELKVLFTSVCDVEQAAAHFHTRHLFIQPLYNAADNTTNVAEAISYILAHPQWRLSLQTHKLLNIR